MATRSATARTPKRPTPSRLGRPPAGDSNATRQRILDTARRSFAERGYEAATNKSLAADAGLTSGALYHYFESKFDLYTAVHEEAQQRVYARFGEAVNGSDTFIGGLEAVLDAAHELNTTDPTLARFLGSVRVDMRRHPELADAFAGPAEERLQFFERLVDIGVRTGEIDVADRTRVMVLIRTMLIGLVDAVSDEPIVHRSAIEALKSLLEGKLLRPPLEPGGRTDARASGRRRR